MEQEKILYVRKNKTIQKCLTLIIYKRKIKQNIKEKIKI